MHVNAIDILISSSCLICTSHYPEQNSSVNTQTVRENQTASSTANLDGENRHKGPTVHKATPNGYLGIMQENKNATDETHPGDANAHEGMPMSPGTLALLCDEEYMFAEDASSDQINNYHSNKDICVEQERLVLMKFRDYLHRLITRGNIKGRILFSTFYVGQRLRELHA